MLDFIEQIGPNNSKHLRKLLFEIPSHVTSLPDWLRVFDVLATQTTGLRCVRFFFNAIFEDDDTCTDYGLGHYQQVAHALGRLSQVEDIFLWGYFVRAWSTYLEEETGATVRANGGRSTGVPEADEGDVVKLNFQRMVREWNTKELKKFEVYQLCTDNGIP
jgi:hypothetical protein